VHRWDNAPQAHSRVSTINFDIWIEGTLYISLEKLPKDGKVLWQRTLLSFGNFSWDMNRVSPNPNIKVDI
jgi:hypothetical protein